MLAHRPPRAVREAHVPVLADPDAPRVGDEQMAGRELAEVVDLAVADHPHRAVLVGDGLGPAGEVDDAEAAMSEPDGSVQVEALAVWAPVGEDGGHAAQQVALHWRAVEAIHPGNPAHRQLARSATLT